MSQRSNSVNETVAMALNHYKNAKAVSLVAQMQSGKTSTYLHIAKGMLGKVSKIVIFSAAAEISLREQTIDRVAKDPELQYVTEVVFGTKLRTYVPDKTCVTLYIWDEAHYGQSTGMLVEDFCKKCHICPTGITREDQKDYLLTVSATPFSEVIDARNSDKLVIFQSPGPSYWGIEDMLDANKIHHYDHLTECFRKLVSQLKAQVGIVRVSEKTFATLRVICCEEGVSYKMFDQSTHGLIEAIQQERDEAEVIFIKGKLRMGCTIENKTNVKWCLDTSESTKTDTLLQGLLGRFCGYTPNKEVDFYIHSECSDKPREYIRYYQSCGVISPKSGMNLKHCSKGRNVYVSKKLEDPQMRWGDKIKTKRIIDNLNIDLLSNARVKFKKTNKMVFTEGTTPSVPEGQGAKYRDEVNVYEQDGEFWILYSTEYIPPNTSTTGQEIFHNPLEFLQSTGNLVGGMRESSFTNMEHMIVDIRDYIQQSKQFSRLNKPIYENRSETQMSKQVYQSLVSGFIHNLMKKKEGVTLTIPEVISERNQYVIVKEIRW